MTTSPQIHFSILTNLASLNTTPQKFCLSLCIINLSLLSANRKYRASACLLDISAISDTIDHNLLLHRLSSYFGISGTALLWFKSYLSSRSFSVKVSNHTSQFLPLSCGVPQGSILGPYTRLLSNLIESSYVDHHLYADETQLFISFSPGLFFHLNFPPTLCRKSNLSMDVIQPTLPQPFQNRIYHSRPTCPNQENPRLFHTIVQ